MALVFPPDTDLRMAISYLRIPEGAETYGADDRDVRAMTDTWRNKNIPIPIEQELQAALTAIGADRATEATKKTEEATESSNALSSLATLATIRDNPSFTNVTRDSAIRVFARVLIWIVKKLLAR